MDAQKWNDVHPNTEKILPGPACERTVGMMGHSVHPEPLRLQRKPRVVTVSDLSCVPDMLEIIHPNRPPCSSLQ